MRRLAIAGALLCSGVALAGPPAASERVLVLRVDDYVGGSVVTSGTGRALWSGTSAMLVKRGIAALPGEAASLVRGLEEARSKQCTVIAMPEFTRYKLGKKELDIGIRIVWYGLDRSERARCEQNEKVPSEKDKEPGRAELALSSIESCLAQVYGEPAVKSPLLPAWLSAHYDLVYATKPDEAIEDPPALGVAATSLADVAKELTVGRLVLVSRAYESGSKLIQRFELYPPAVAAEAHAEIAEIEIGSRLRSRLVDRAIEGLLDALRARGESVAGLSQLMIPAADPLDRIITVVPIVLPRSKLVLERELDSGTGPPLLWARLTVSADGTVQEAVALTGEDSPLLEQAKQAGGTPGTRGGQPQEMRVLVPLENWPPDKRD